MLEEDSPSCSYCKGNFKGILHERPHPWQTQLQWFALQGQDLPFFLPGQEARQRAAMSLKIDRMLRSCKIAPVQQTESLEMYDVKVSAPHKNGLCHFKECPHICAKQTS